MPSTTNVLLILAKSWVSKCTGKSEIPPAHRQACKYIYIYIYIYHTIPDVYTTALLLTKPSSDDDFGFRHGFGAEASLPLAQSAPAVSHDTTRLLSIVVALQDCQIHADAVRALFWIFSMYILLSDGGSPRLYTHTHTHTHTHIYIYGVVQKWVFFIHIRGEVANMLGCYIVINEFESQSPYYVYFQINIPGKSMNPLIIQQLWKE